MVEEEAKEGSKRTVPVIDEFDFQTNTQDVRNMRWFIYIHRESISWTTTSKYKKR